jgi:hypothetical protein
VIFEILIGIAIVLSIAVVTWSLLGFAWWVEDIWRNGW